jgi:hypothetical protein
LVRDERPSLELIIGKISKLNWENIIFTAISQYPQTSTSFKPGGFESTPNLFTDFTGTRCEEEYIF